MKSTLTLTVLLLIGLTGCGVERAGDTAVKKGALITLTCSDELGLHANGSSWRSPDGCNNRSCKNGNIRETLLACK